MKQVSVIILAITYIVLFHYATNVPFLLFGAFDLDPNDTVNIRGLSYVFMASLLAGSVCYWVIQKIVGKFTVRKILLAGLMAVVVLVIYKFIKLSPEGFAYMIQLKPVHTILTHLVVFLGLPISGVIVGLSANNKLKKDAWLTQTLELQTRGTNMSIENNVFLLRENLPTPQQWLDAIKSHGFEMEMDIDFNIVEHEGFLPCKYKGKDAGFEYWTEEVDINGFIEEEMITPEEANQIGNRSFLVTLTTHSDFREYMTSMIASAVLCSISDGILAEAGEPPFILSSNAIKWAKEGVPEIEKEL